MPPPDRSALADFPGPVPARPTVGIVVPVYNERPHLADLVADLLAQDYAAVAEIWFVDGGSDDGSAAWLRDRLAADTRVRVVGNPRRLPAAALNIAIPQMRTDIVLRLDAHARYAPDVVSRCVEALLATGAGGVGASLRPAPGRTPIAQSIVAAHATPFALGGAKCRRENAVGWADTVWNGCYWRHVVDQVGRFREDLWRAEDNDFNERVRRLGYGLHLSPAIKATYVPRQTYRGLWQQYFGNGFGVSRAWFANPRAFGLRHLVPAVFVLLLLVLSLAGVVWAPARALLGAVLALYAIALAVATACAAWRRPRPDLLLLPVAISVLHFAYGSGALWGLATRRWRALRLSPARLALVLCLAGLLPAASSMPEPAGPTIWLAGDMERIGREQQPGPAASILLHAARGETVAFQLGINGGARGLHGVTVSLEPIGDAPVTLYREHYVKVTGSSPDLAGSNRPQPPGWFADPLEPLPEKRAFTVPAAQNQPIWIDVAVPRDARAGRYAARLLVRSDEGDAVGTVDLVVWNFALPPSPFLDSMFLVWDRQHAANAAEELLRHRLMPRSVDAASEARLIAELGLKSVNIGLWSDATHTQCAMSPEPDPSVVAEAAHGHAPGLHLYNYTADEIDDCPSSTEAMRRWGRALHGAGVDNLVTMSPLRALLDDGSGTGRSAVDVWVLLPVMYDRSRALVAQVLAKGDKVWSYNALVQDPYSPKWEIDFTPVDFRIVPGFMSERLGLSGLLYWRVDGWTADPWHDVQTYRRGGNDYPGEGMLTYPGAAIGREGVVPAMRLKWLRDGVNDYDYLQLAKQLGCPVDRSVRTVAESWRLWTHDPAIIERERLRIGALLDRRTCQEARQEGP